MEGGSHSIALDGAEYLIGGDLVTRIDGIRLGSDEALGHITQGLAIGKHVQVTYYRDGHEHTAVYKLFERPPALDARLTTQTAGNDESQPTGLH